MRLEGVKANTMLEGGVFLIRNAVDVSLQVPQVLVAGAGAQELDLVAALRVAFIELLDSQGRCLAAQKLDYVRSRVAASDGEDIEGYVSKADLGFAQYIHLKSATISASGSKYVTIDAGSFQLSVKVRGSMDSTYLDALKQLLVELDGVAATIAATKIATMQSHLIGASTIFVNTTPFSAQ